MAIGRGTEELLREDMPATVNPARAFEVFDSRAVMPIWGGPGPSRAVSLLKSPRCELGSTHRESGGAMNCVACQAPIDLASKQCGACGVAIDADGDGVPDVVAKLIEDKACALLASGVRVEGDLFLGAVGFIASGDVWLFTPGPGHLYEHLARCRVLLSAFPDVTFRAA